jgi:hypothetical protein
MLAQDDSGGLTRESTFRAALAVRRPANPITFCDCRGIDFGIAAGRILVAVLTWLMIGRS